MANVSQSSHVAPSNRPSSDSTTCNSVRIAQNRTCGDNRDCQDEASKLYQNGLLDMARGNAEAARAKFKEVKKYYSDTEAAKLSQERLDELASTPEKSPKPDTPEKSPEPEKKTARIDEEHDYLNSRSQVSEGPSGIGFGFAAGAGSLGPQIAAAVGEDTVLSISLLPFVTSDFFFFAGGIKFMQTFSRRHSAQLYGVGEIGLMTVPDEFTLMSLGGGVGLRYHPQHFDTFYPWLELKATLLVEDSEFALYPLPAVGITWFFGE